MVSNHLKNHVLLSDSHLAKKESLSPFNDPRSSKSLCLSCPLSKRIGFRQKYVDMNFSNCLHLMNYGSSANINMLMWINPNRFDIIGQAKY